MAWINIIAEDEAQGELKGWYDKLREPWGGVDNILRVHSMVKKLIPLSFYIKFHKMYEERSPLV